jgi:hypothetical protein
MIDGVFIYEFSGDSIKRIGTPLIFAEKKRNIDTTIEQNLRNPARFKRTFVEREINRIQIGEYSEKHYEIHYMPCNIDHFPDVEFDFEKVSEELAEEKFIEDPN